MKKILTILSSLTLISSATISVVACQQPTQDEGVAVKPIFVISLAEIENQNMSDEEIITNLTEQLNKFTDEQLTVKTDFIIDPILRDSETQQLLAQKINVNAVKASNKLKEDVELYLKRDFKYMNEWINFKGSNYTLAQEIKNKVLNEIKRWAPEVKENIDYIDFTDFPSTDPNGKWRIEFNPDSKLISGDKLEFTPKKFDLSTIKENLILDVDQYDNVDKIIPEINKYINNYAPYAELNKDYYFENIIETTPTGEIAGQTIWVDSGDSHGNFRYLEKDRAIYLKKDLTNIFTELFSQWPTASETDKYTWIVKTKADADLALQQVQERLKFWVPSINPDKDYDITIYNSNSPDFENGSWTFWFEGEFRGKKFNFDSNRIDFLIRK